METAGFVKKGKTGQKKTHAWTQYQDQADMKVFWKIPEYILVLG
jgi:hypothetical protein